jgi:hypothetical protein
MKALGYEGHQFIIVAHDDKKHFHIHIMLNKVHMEMQHAMRILQRLANPRQRQQERGGR